MTGHRQQGTTAGYGWHYTNKIFPVCEPCRQAHAADLRMRRDLRKLIAVLAELLEPPVAVCISCRRSLRTSRNCPYCGQRDAREYRRAA